MITASTWQRELSEAITSIDELLEVLGLPHDTVADRGALQFPMRVPRSFVARMRHGDPADPLLRQILPLDVEAQHADGYARDPLQERAAIRAPGLLHKYRGRALLIATQACAVHCRYCFRREFPYHEQHDDTGRWSRALAAIAADPSIHELILSGGDPLTLSCERLGALTDAAQAISHLRRLRIHTRVAVVLPSRVDAGLLDWLRGLRVPCVIVLHINHAQEIDAEVRAACARLKTAGVTLLNQSVLLRGINDSERALTALSETLFDCGVLPYYLHLPDRVAGTAHFAVPDEEAQRLLGALAAQLPGYLVPRLVREIAGAPAKVALLPEFCEPQPVFERRGYRSPLAANAKLRGSDAAV